MKFHHQFEIHGTIIGMETNSSQLAMTANAETVHSLGRCFTLERSLDEKSKELVIESRGDWFSGAYKEFPCVVLEFSVNILAANRLWSELPQKGKEDILALGWVGS